MKKKIIVADDHILIRKGICLLLKSLGYNEVNEVSTCNELLKELKNTECTHLLLDVVFPDGTALEILPNIRQLYPDLNILIFSMQPVDVYGPFLKKYNINYYLSKSLNAEDTVLGLRKYLNDEAVTPQNKTAQSDHPFATLSPREMEVLHYLLNSFHTKEISEVLNLGMSTVSTLKKRIFEKAGTENIVQLIELAKLYDVKF